MPTDQDPLLPFIDDAPKSGQVIPESSEPLKWRVLSIDDDPGVHEATRLCFDQVKVLGRSLDLLFASSALEARDILLTEKDLALILLDVVMETESAGLELVDFIRNVANLKATRIVLRTGQPGYAPEYETIVNHDINDYKSKADLSHLQLLTTVTAALRSYEQIRILDANRNGLARIVQASNSLMSANNLQDFAASIITQLAAVLGARVEGLVCATDQRAPQRCLVLAAVGRFSSAIDQPLDTLHDETVRLLLSTALSQGGNVVTPAGIALYFDNKQGLEMVAYIEKSMTPDGPDQDLLDIFCANVCACLNNLSLKERLNTQAYFDTLSGLPNRARFIENIEAAIEGTKAQTNLALVDIDDFSSVNDLMGHTYGDRLLKAYGARLQQTLGPDVVIARVASNTFGLLGSYEKVNPDIVQKTVLEPLPLGITSHRISVTSGFATLQPDSQRGDDWIKDLHIALKHAKRHQRGLHVLFTSLMGQESRARAQLLSNLYSAFSQTQLFVMYQPQIDLLTRCVVGLEALVRWRTEDGRMVPPDQFIPVAEQSGLILPLGEWVLQTACNTMKQLDLQGLAPARMAVNVSVIQFQRPDFIERIENALHSNGLTATQLELEITESVAMLGSSTVKSTLAALRDKGICVAVDDFGTGFSSLSYLNSLPIDRLKIDRAFVQGMRQDSGPHIAEMITMLGLEMGLKVLAEGIENEEVLLSLKTMGCHEGQGFHIAKPMEYDELVTWLQQKASANHIGNILVPT